MKNTNRGKLRTFTVGKSWYKGINGGIYTGTDPFQAARKAFRQLCLKSKTKSCRRKFELRETTQEASRDKKQKVFKYQGIKRKLKSPKILKGREIEYEYKINSIK